MGYSPYQWVTNSDHRAIFLDLDYTRLFQEDQPTTILDYASRGIRSNDIQRCQIFVSQFYNHLQANNAEDQLRAIVNNTATVEDVETFNKLIRQAGDSAEKHCKRRRPEFYSVTIHQLRIKMSIAKYHYNNLKHQHERPSHNQASLQHRLDRAQISMTLHDDIKQAKNLLHEISHQQKEATKTS
jgi:hypothetical protein